MRFTEADATDGPLIRAYGPGWIRVDDTEYRHSLALGPDRIRPWRPEAVTDLETADLDYLLDDGPEILILGTGARQCFPPPALLARPARRGIGIEVMDTPAACRTYNILAGEGRRVAAGLMTISAEDAR